MPFSSVIPPNSYDVSGIITIAFLILSLLCMAFVCMNAGAHVDGKQKTPFESEFTPSKWCLRIELGALTAQTSTDYISILFLLQIQM